MEKTMENLLLDLHFLLQQILSRRQKIANLKVNYQKNGRDRLKIWMVGITETYDYEMAKIKPKLLVSLIGGSKKFNE